MHIVIFFLSFLIKTVLVLKQLKGVFILKGNKLIIACKSAPFIFGLWICYILNYDFTHEKQLYTHSLYKPSSLLQPLNIATCGLDEATGWKKSCTVAV